MLALRQEPLLPFRVCPPFLKRGRKVPQAPLPHPVVTHRVNGAGADARSVGQSPTQM